MEYLDSGYDDFRSELLTLEEAHFLLCAAADVALFEEETSSDPVRSQMVADLFGQLFSKLELISLSGTVFDSGDIPGRRAEIHLSKITEDMDDQLRKIVQSDHIDDSLQLSDITVEEDIKWQAILGVDYCLQSAYDMLLDEEDSLSAMFPETG